MIVVYHPNHCHYLTQSTSTCSSSSSYLNRSILQRWKRALHVPLRLDVYYQHADSTRELLERWCLEYAPKPAHHNQHHLHQNGFVNQAANPIVQLRQVCKQIVIWLRSLYCWSRMLPAQALRRQNTNNSAIGFSIYVVSEGNDDVSGLVSSQGFYSQQQPHSVWTPYGELGWKVFYAPKQTVQRLIPEIPPYATQYNTQTTSRPIPMGPRQQQHQASPQDIQPQSYHPTREITHREMEAPERTTMTAHSAPHNTGRMYHRSKSDVSDMQRQAAIVASVDGHGHYMQQQQKPDSNGAANGHAQFAQGPLPSTNPNDKSAPTSSNSTDGNAPTKNRSALSLAMMMIGDKKGNEPHTNDGANSSASHTTQEAAEKRRAALHHAPPQLAQSPVLKKPPLGTAGEYGYAYNTHIPPIRPNNNNNNGLIPNNITPPNQVGASALHPNRASDGAHVSPLFASTTPLGSTPPGYLLGGPTPPAAMSNLSTLIPPRGAVTPPFTRPMGFVGEPPSQDPLPAQAATMPIAGHDHQLQNHMTHQTMTNTEPRAPLTSLDLLHSSPFQQPVYGSILGGSSNAAAVATDPFGVMGSGLGLGSDPMTLGMLGSMAGGSTTGGGASFGPRMDDLDDMPFAVDPAEEGGGSIEGSTTQHQESTALAISSLTSSAILREMSQPPKRLQMFDSLVPPGTGSSSVAGTSDPIHALAEQLAELKTFGASLVVSSSATSAADGDVATNMHAPISIQNW